MLKEMVSAIVSLTIVSAIGCHSPRAVGPDPYTMIDDMEHDEASFAWGDGWTGLWYASTRCPAELPSGLSPSPYFLQEDHSGWTFESLGDQSYETFPGVVSRRAARLTANLSLSSGSDTRTWGANMNVDLTQPSSLGLDGAPSASIDAGGIPASIDAGGIPASIDAGGIPASIDAGTPSSTQDCRPSTRIFPGDPVKLGPYSGLVFWAKADVNVKHRIRIMVHDVNSDPRGEQCFGEKEPSSKEELEGCYNAFLTTRDLTDTFTRYEVDFSELWRDQAWGYHPDPNARDVLERDRIYLLVFEVLGPKCVTDQNARCVGGAPDTLSFDFWIDDLYLVKRK